VRVGASAVDEFRLTSNLGNGLNFGGREKVFDLQDHSPDYSADVCEAPIVPLRYTPAVKNELPESLGRSPELFPHALDVRGDSVSFIRLSRADYVKASFLDSRVLTPRSIEHMMPWRHVVDAIEAARLPERCAFIFHIGHVGSTLLSRLIGAHPRAFALREPMILRTCAQLSFEPEARPQAWSEGDFDARLSGCLKLLSRTFDDQQHAVIKATSFVSEMATALLSRASAPKALTMYISPESYLATILGGANSRPEAKMLAPYRLRRLHRRIGGEAWQLGSLSEGELLALGWACEMSALAHASRAAGARILRVDFDQFLARPATFLFAALCHFNIDATPSEAHTILQGPDMYRYSKAPEHAYDAALRSEVLNEARATHGAEIQRGLAWLDRAAAQFSAVRDAMELAENAPPLPPSR
jgi:hypothetical protein